MASDQTVEDFLEHFGVRGMHWGIHKKEMSVVDQLNANSQMMRRGLKPGDRADVPRKVNRLAEKDAHEYTRAKLFYGEGAGTRRKLIKAKVEHNRKHIDGYSEAFDSHSALQNLSAHVTKATKERHSIDRRDKNKKRASAVARRLTGEWGTQAAFVALAVSGAAFANSIKGRQFLNTGISKIKNTKSDFTRKQGAKHISDILKNMK